MQAFTQNSIPKIHMKFNFSTDFSKIRFFFSLDLIYARGKLAWNLHLFKIHKYIRLNGVSQAFIRFLKFDSYEV